MNYMELLNDWKNHDAVEMFSSFERIILRLADGRANEIEDLTWNRTHIEVAKALISRLIQ